MPPVGHAVANMFALDPASDAVMQLWPSAVTASKRESQARRAHVLAYPDLAQRLGEPPLRLSNPSRWSGWIPPRRLAEDACTRCQRDDRRCGGLHRSRVNRSATEWLLPGENDG
jgi:hypothetical protein